MAEMPNVVTNEVVESEWGNAIRDRTVQRYATVTERATLHPSPTEGDLAYMEDSDIVLVYNGTAWVPLVTAYEVDGSNQAVGPVSVPTTLGVLLTLNLAIPASWVTWKCEAYGHAAITPTGACRVNLLVAIDGTDGLGLAVSGDMAGGVSQWASASPAFRRSGLTTTGSRAITLKGVTATGAAQPAVSLYLYARATRLT